MAIEIAAAGLINRTRWKSLRRLAFGPRASEITTGFAISQPAIYKQALLLTRAGLIHSRKSAPKRIHELAPSGGKTMRKALEQLREMERYWNRILEAFKRYAEKNMKQSQVEPNRNGAIARKETER
jgi:predicted transcriptional regulator